MLRLASTKFPPFLKDKLYAPRYNTSTHIYKHKTPPKQDSLNSGTVVVFRHMEFYITPVASPRATMRGSWVSLCMGICAKISRFFLPNYRT